MIETRASDSVWQPVYTDATLSRPPTPGSPGNVPTGEDLRLDIGWDRFEQLLVHLAGQILGLNQLKFRRYGTSGQAQHGIDLAGRRADGSYVVVQCKEHSVFAVSDLQTAVARFADGKRPFDARHLVVAVSTTTRTTQLDEELARLQDHHRDLTLELWGAEQINDELRPRADIVARFWTRETAETFCTAPLPGVPAPPPDWLRITDQVLLTPLSTGGLDVELARAEAMTTTEPISAAAAYDALADRVAADGFAGHAYVLRRRQLDVLVKAGQLTAAVELAADLSATALHEGDAHRARELAHRLDQLVAGKDDDPALSQHVGLISAAVGAVQHPGGDSSRLALALRETSAGPRVAYRPLLALLLCELSAADAVVTPSVQPFAPEGGDDPTKLLPDGAALVALADVIDGALDEARAPATRSKDIRLRLRLLKSAYDPQERTLLLTQARQYALPRPHAALVLAGQARREALDGSALEALEHWRQAVAHALHDAKPIIAAAWLYAVRGVRVRYGPWTTDLDEEHLLAESLPKEGGGELLARVRDPETETRRAAMAGRAGQAVNAGRRWLSESIVTGSWADEQTAASILGDLYRQNSEPDRAAACYQWAGSAKELAELAQEVGDLRLTPSPVGRGPWWQQRASLRLVEVQHDLVDDETAARALRHLLDTARRGRRGELSDGPAGELLLQVVRTLGVLAGRGSANEAGALLNLLAEDVAREPNQYSATDRAHVNACRTIARHHPALAHAALTRIVDLAAVETQDALEVLPTDVVELLKPGGREAGTVAVGLSTQQAVDLRARLIALAKDGRYHAVVAVAALVGHDDAVVASAIDARQRVLNRPQADGMHFSFGSQLVNDAYLISYLPVEDQQSCLHEMLRIASDRKEAANARRDALAGARNLVLDQPDELRAHVYSRARSFAEGHEDGSALDDRMTNPHPLSNFKVDMGSPSLRGAGLRLAHASAVEREDLAWVKDTGIALIRSQDDADVRAAAGTLSQLDADLLADSDPALLAGHRDHVVRQLAAVVAVTRPERNSSVLASLAKDPDRRVRTLLAHRLVQASAADAHTMRARVTASLLAVLRNDPRHSVRRAAEGLAF